MVEVSVFGYDDKSLQVHACIAGRFSDQCLIENCSFKDADLFPLKSRTWRSDYAS